MRASGIGARRALILTWLALGLVVLVGGIVLFRWVREGAPRQLRDQGYWVLRSSEYARPVGEAGRCVVGPGVRGLPTPTRRDGAHQLRARARRWGDSDLLIQVVMWNTGNQWVRAFEVSPGRYRVAFRDSSGEIHAVRVSQAGEDMFLYEHELPLLMPGEGLCGNYLYEGFYRRFQVPFEYTVSVCSAYRGYGPPDRTVWLKDSTAWLRVPR